MTDLTPELYARINESTDADAESLHEQWEAAGCRAHDRFLALRDRLPPTFADLCETRCLHDADVLSVTTSRGGDPQEASVAVVGLRQGADLLTLTYDLVKPLERSVPRPSRAFSSAMPVTWLYDEVHAAGDAAFRHEVLLSTGEVLVIEFFQFSISVHHTPRVPQPGGALALAGG